MVGVYSCFMLVSLQEIHTKNNKKIACYLSASNLKHSSDQSQSVSQDVEIDLDTFQTASGLSRSTRFTCLVVCVCVREIALIYQDTSTYMSQLWHACFHLENSNKGISALANVTWTRPTIVLALNVFLNVQTEQTFSINWLTDSQTVGYVS